MTCVTGAQAGAAIFWVPIYALFLRVGTIVNGQTIESVNQYNMVYLAAHGTLISPGMAVYWAHVQMELSMLYFLYLLQ